MKNLKIQLWVLLLVIGFFALVTIWYSSEKKNKDEVKDENTVLITEEAGNVEYITYLLDDTESKLNEISKLIETKNNPKFSLIQKVSAQDLGLTTEQNEILNIVNEIDFNLSEIQLIINNYDQDLDTLLKLLEQRLTEIENQYQIIVDENSSEDVILVKLVGESINELDEDILENSEKTTDTKLAIEIIENKLRKQSMKYEALLQIRLIQIGNAATENDSYIDIALAEAAGILEEIRINIASSNIELAYTNLREFTYKLDTIEDELESVSFENTDEVPVELQRLEAIEKLQSALNKIEKAEKVLNEELLLDEVSNEVNSLLQTANNLRAEANLEFENGNYLESITLSRNSIDQSKLATKIAKDKDNQELDEMLKEINEKLEEVRLLLLELDSYTGDSKHVSNLESRAVEFSSQAESALNTGNYSLAENAVRNAKNFAEEAIDAIDEDEDSEKRKNDIEDRLKEIDSKIIEREVNKANENQIENKNREEKANEINDLQDDSKEDEVENEEEIEIEDEQEI
ncbi:MAG: hypothetical protein Q9M91_01450 [Candidatus Dojkabacteria bacterium]|nr:hypothetical protein [Candidatus Dojkabacteria bacterium]MDQ7020490.1 hypothetical protein [Candidatus Dojkabacteria bacterium]